MKRHQTSSAGKLLLAAILVSLSAPVAADHDGQGVTLFRDAHFQGRYETFYEDVPHLARTDFGNDRASSLAVSAGCHVTLYRDRYFRGPSITVRHDVADLGASRIGNDQVTSLEIDCGRGRYGNAGRRGHEYEERYARDGGEREYGYEGRRYGGRRYEGRRYGVTVFADAGFRGRRETIDCDDPDLRDNRIRQDTISSVHVPPGCRAVLFEDVGFRGDYSVIDGDVDNMRYLAPGNDRVSSIQVDCR